MRAGGQTVVDGVGDLRQTPGGDQLGHVVGVDHHLGGRYTPPLDGGQQPLRHDAFQCGGQIGQQGSTVLRRIEAQDAVQRMGGVVGVQRGQHQVAGLRVGNGSSHGLDIADLADQDAVGRLAQRTLERGVQVTRVGADLALVDDGELVAEDELDRVFQREDVAGAVGVAVVDQRGQRGGLAHAGGPHHQEEAARLQDQLLQHGRHAQRVELGDVAGNVADDGSRGAPLAEQRNPEAAHVLQAVADVEFVLVLKTLPLLVVDGRAQQGLGLLRGQALVRSGQRMHGAVDLDLDRGAHGDEEVGGLLLGHHFQQLVDRHDRFGCLVGTETHARVQCGYVSAEALRMQPALW